MSCRSRCVLRYSTKNNRQDEKDRTIKLLSCPDLGPCLSRPLTCLCSCSCSSPCPCPCPYLHLSRYPSFSLHDEYRVWTTNVGRLISCPRRTLRESGKNVSSLSLPLSPIGGGGLVQNGIPTTLKITLGCIHTSSRPWYICDRKYEMPKSTDDVDIPFILKLEVYTSKHCGVIRQTVPCLFVT
ncbi:hypothetical protein BO70DRAFT_124749 [Aspergillus heteromorphus CBS 117.55]|uniref:Uncharacterized protein n=1 Tax=Aspergillus heteromorphus CBS 117.55 TaxID=1448321 RepID=A0A317VCF6_9EURO|nr:uncharacterized protein BO70DRAFT_124749 [Aspergillus heteromorphus CBS 117.55]PWY70931.1 hypothetical protein BO70DRAFT_124749 [Aspergillus heteromorphus CBS 117.55]